MRVEASGLDRAVCALRHPLLVLTAPSPPGLPLPVTPENGTAPFVEASAFRPKLAEYPCRCIGSSSIWTWMPSTPPLSSGTTRR